VLAAQEAHVCYQAWYDACHLLERVYDGGAGARAAPAPVTASLLRRLAALRPEDTRVQSTSAFAYTLDALAAACGAHSAQRPHEWPPPRAAAVAAERGGAARAEPQALGRHGWQ
jgi:hypothetical protein